MSDVREMSGGRSGARPSVTMVEFSSPPCATVFLSNGRSGQITGDIAVQMQQAVEDLTFGVQVPRHAGKKANIPAEPSFILGQDVHEAIQRVKKNMVSGVFVLPDILTLVRALEDIDDQRTSVRWYRFNCELHDYADDVLPCPYTSGENCCQNFTVVADADDFDLQNMEPQWSNNDYYPERRFCRRRWLCLKCNVRGWAWHPMDDGNTDPLPNPPHRCADSRKREGVTQ